MMTRNSAYTSIRHDFSFVNYGSIFFWEIV